PYAYRFGGFGTHEYVIYYELLRYLLTECLEHVRSEQVRTKRARTEEQSFSRSRELASRVDFATEAARLEGIKQAWLNEPQDEFDGRIPSAMIESERRRIPLVMLAKQMMIDKDCDVCRMIAGETGEDFGPGFWHLDGCNMDEGFAFSTCRDP
ncbi:MAG: hypothetical protein ACRD2L_03890, partial [Terriglobia bacterium]